MLTPIAEVGGRETQDSGLRTQGWLDRTFDVTRIRGEVVAWAGVLLAASGLRLAGLQDHALSPDGARRAFAAYALYTGHGADLSSAAGGPFRAPFGAPLYFLFRGRDGGARP